MDSRREGNPVRVGLVTCAMNRGGVETFILRLGGYLTRAGFAVEVVTTEGEGAWQGLVSEAGLRLHDLTGLGAAYPNVLRSISLGRALRALDYDVLILNHARLVQAALGHLPDRTVAIPVVHNDSPEIYRVACGHPEAWNVIAADSPRVFARTVEHVPGRPVVEINYGVVLPEADDWKRRRPFALPLQLVFAGRIAHRHKGVLHLPGIVRGCLQRGLDVVLTVIGEGDDLPALRAACQQEDLSGRVRFVGALRPEDVYRHLLRAHVLLMPSYFEGFPTVALEAQACGCVPICSRLPGITDLSVEEGVSGLLVEVDEVGGFAEGVQSLYHAPERWAAMSAAGHERVERQFSVEAMGAAYATLIREALRGRYPLPGSRRGGFPLDLSMYVRMDLLPRGLARWLAVRLTRGRRTAVTSVE